jgi:hypothetical protein
MRALFGLLVVAFVLIVGGSYAWNRMRQVPLVAPARFPEKKAADPTEGQETQKMVKMTGPLADYMANEEGSDQALKVETLEYTPRKPSASDHVGGSVVGSTAAILHKTFGVRAAVELPFEVPAHAASPHLHGSYRSFLKQAGPQIGDPDDAIEFLVLNQQQYDGFLHGHSGEATFSAEDSNDQQVNASLPPTVDQPEKYHLVFRNNSRGHGRKFVQADFRIDF